MQVPHFDPLQVDPLLDGSTLFLCLLVQLYE